MYFIQHCFVCRHSDSTVSEDAGIEPRTVATSALAVRRSITTRLDLIQGYARFHPHEYFDNVSPTSKRDKILLSLS
jgi:hypothetical protein